MDIDSKGVIEEPLLGLPNKDDVSALIQNINEKIQRLGEQYESQLHNLRSDLDRNRPGSHDDDTDRGSSASPKPDNVQQQYKETKDKIGKSLPGEQKDELDSLVSDMDRTYQDQLQDMHRQHVDDVDKQVKAMRSTLEEIYSNQMDIVKSEMEQSNQAALLDLRQHLEKDHKDEINTLEQEWTTRFDKLKREYETTFQETSHDETFDQKDTTTVVSRLHQRMTDEHRQIIEKIEAELGTKTLTPRKRAETKDSSTDTETEELGSAVSAPVTQAEIDHAQQKHGILTQVEDVKQSLESQAAEIAAVRAQMLSEYEQLMAARAGTMTSQESEVERLQQELADLQEQYEAQAREVQDKFDPHLDASAKPEFAAAHAKELEEMKQYYESKVAEMEQSYTMDITKLKQEHAELIAKLQEESANTSTTLPSSSQAVSAVDKQREYVRKTTTLTALSDEDETPPPSPQGSNVLEGRIKLLEDKLKEREKVVDELKKRLEAETSSAEDLHGRLCDYEETLRAKVEEAEELKKALSSKDDRINVLENEKAALEEKGEKESEQSESKLLAELKEKVKKLENDLSASKETNKKIQEELNQLHVQHDEAIKLLKEEMETSFKIQLKEELDQQEEELMDKYGDDLNRKSEEIEVYRRTEEELKAQLANINSVHEKQLNELTEKYEGRAKSLSSSDKIKELQEPQIEISETFQVQTVSPSESVDRDSLEASIRENVRAEILQEYEQSIDKLKSEYEDRITELNSKLETFQSRETEKAQTEETGKTVTDDERKTLKAGLAQEYKDKLDKVTDEYEDKLKHLQDIVEGKKGDAKPPASPLARSQSLDIDTANRDANSEKIPKEYEGFVSSLKRDYENRIQSLQKEIAQYQTSLQSVPSSPQMPKPQDQVSTSAEEEKSDLQKSEMVLTQVSEKPEAVSPELRQEIYNEIASEFEVKMSELKSYYEKQLEELRTDQSESQTESKGESDLLSKTKEEIIEEYENRIRILKSEYEDKLKKADEELQKALSDKTAAEQKVKADMFVWHEEIVSQLKRKHEENISQLRKEYEEKMELYREEMQEEFDAEKERMEIQHKKDIVELEDRYDNLVEGLRSGENPEVAEIVQEKFDMELEMAKTLIQQECDETIEAEQVRMSEDFEKQIKQMRNEREQDLEELKVRHEKEMDDLRNTLLQQYESQVIEMSSQHEDTLLKTRQKYEALLEKAKQQAAKTGEISPPSQKSLDSKVSEESEIEEDISEKVTTESYSEFSEKDDDDDDDDGDDLGGPKKGDGGDEGGDKPSEKEDRDSDEDGSGGKSPESQEARDGDAKDKPESTETEGKQAADTTGADDAEIESLKQELAEKIAEYEVKIAQLKVSHEKEVQGLREQLEKQEAEYQLRIQDLEQGHSQEVREYQEMVDQLRQDAADNEASEAMEAAHQQELQDLEDRLVTKHRHELENLETRHQSKLQEMEDKHKVQMEALQRELTQAQQALDQYPDTVTQEQIVPVFHAGSTLGSTGGSATDFMTPTQEPILKAEVTSATQIAPEVSQGATPSEALIDAGTMETQVFEVRTSSEDLSPRGSLQGTLEEVGVRSLDTSMDQSRGTLRGVDDTQDTELIHFSEESESDKSIDEGTVKSDRSTPPALLQTMGYGAAGPTVKSLDDTTDDSFRVSDREEMTARIKELEGEVEELKKKLQQELNKQDDQMDRLDREKQEESNLVAMLRRDIERLNTDREAFQNTNEHLLGLLSDAVKTYMNVEESIHSKLKGIMDKSGDIIAQGSVDKGRPGSAEKRRTPPPTAKRSPVASPGRLSPARADDSDNVQETSILSNITDEGLDLSQRISDSIFQGPELASEEEELLTDSGSRLRSSVSRLLEMIEETTSQLLDTRNSQSELMGALEGRSEELEQQTARCRDLEERLKEEVERKDYLALELHKAEGLIEGYESERDTLDQRIQELEEQKETLVLELETMRNKLLDMTSTQSENEQLKKELQDQQQILSGNVGEEAQALMLEVSRLNSENREKEQQIKHVHERFESRVRELETSGEDTEHHFTKLLDDKKQEVTDLKLQVDALEKQVKSKKQFIEEQSSEREQEREDYQTELDKWKKLVQDLEKQNGNGSRLQREVDDLNEQLQNRIDLHNEALLEAERHQRETRDRDLSIQELKSIIQQLETEVQERTSQAESDKQKLKKLEEELSRRPYPDDDTSDSVKSDSMEMKTAASLEMERAADDKHARLLAQLTVEEELREAAKKTKEELVREKHVLQTQLNECLVQISGLRNQLDEMRHRKDFTDTADAVRRLETEREKSEEKDKEISDLKLKVEQLGETVDNRDQQIQQLKDRSKLTRGTPIDGYEYESDKEIEKQLDTLRTENKQLKAKLSQSQPVVTDMSGLSQSLIEEKNQEIDQLSEEVQRLQAEYTELRAERGVENMYLELEQLRDEMKVKDREIADLQSVRVSQSFTDHSLTPDSSLLNVGASFSEKASIQQEMEESEAARIEKMTNLESEVQSLKSALQAMEEENSGLKEKVQEQAAELEKEDVGMLQDMVQEKEELITQLTVQVDSLQAEVDNLSDFQNKLQEDFDTVQTMLEEKDKEIENLTKELTDRSPESTGEDHSLVIKHEVEIAKLKKDLREKDNVVEEKLEELAELTDKVELLESHIQKYRDQEKMYDEQIVEKDREIRTLKKDIKADSQAVIQEQKEEIENLKENLQKVLGRPPSPPLTEDEKTALIKQQKVEIESLKTEMEATSLGRPPSPPDDGEKADVIKRLRQEIGKLRQQIMDSNLSEDDKSVLIRELRLENETLKRQIDAALKIRPPSPPRDEEESAEIIEEQKKEIEELKVRLETVMKIEPPSPPRSEDEKSVLIRKQEKEITKLKKRVEEALQISPPPLPLSEDEKDQIIEQKETEVELLKSELSKVSDAVNSGEQGKLIQEKVEEVVKLQTELNDVKRKLSESSQGSIQEKEEQIREREEQLKVASEKVKKLEEELQSAKEVRAYEDEIELKEKEDEIEELQAELECYRTRGEGSFTQSIDLEGSLSESGSPKHLVRSMTFYKEQYEEKCSENRQLQVSNDLLKEQLEKSRSQKLEDSPEEIDLYKADIERKIEHKVEELKKEKESLTKELTEVKQKMSQSSDERIVALEKEVQMAKEEAARERLDSVQAINDLETLRDRKERERRGSLKYVHELESDLDQKHAKEKQLSVQVKQLTEELTQIKRQYGIEDKPGSTSSGKSSESRLQSQGSFELGTDVDTLQQQVLQFKQTADKAKEILSEKQKYQSQVVKLEIQQENLQKQMKKEVSQLEEELKTYRTKSDQDVGMQLHATQEKLEKTTEQLIETSDRLQETEKKMQKISEDLKETQQDLWKTSGQLALTSGKLQETEEKLKLTLSQVSEREDQIHQLQSELQHTQQEIEQETKKTKADKPEEVQKLKEKLQSSEEELEAVKVSLKEAVEMSEQQLQMSENKDKEFVKLKLDIQKTITSKDKTIKEQKKELKEKEQEVFTLKENIKKLQQQSSSTQTDEQAASVSALKAQLQKVMNLKDELSTEHQRHVQELTLRAQQDTETQLATMRIKYTDEIEHIRRTHIKELEEKQRDLQQKLERSHKGEMNRLILRHQEEVGALRSRNGVPLDDVSQDLGRRPDGAGQEGARLVNGHGSEPMSSKLQGILRRLNREGVEVLTISELEYLSRRQSQSELPDNADPESLKTGWENERQSLLSTIQSLKDLLAQTHRLQGMDKAMEGSDWRAELLRSIGYVFSREREALLAELRSHVLAFPNANSDELQRLEQKIRTQEAHQHASLDQIFNADRQSMLAEVRDLRAHATIARMHNQEERDRLSEKVTSAEDQALKKERQLKKQVQLLEFKIQQEKLLQEDLKTSLDTERTRTGDLSSQLNQEKVSNLDLHATLTSLQVQVSKLKENLEREQSRYVSVTNALEEEKSKSLNLSEVLESERETLWRVQAELETLKQQQRLADPRALEELERELRAERESRCQAESQHEIDCVTLDNLRQEMEMERRHQAAKETEMGAKVTQLQKMADMEKKRAAELDLAFERERSLNARLHRNLEAAESNIEATGVDRACVHDLQVQLDTERAKVDDLERALQREQEVQDEMVASVETEKSVLKDNLQQEREINKTLKHEVDKLQFERLEAVNKLQKERDMVQRVKSEREQMTEELRRLRVLETQRDQDREAEKMAERKTLRQADREKDDIRMKMHEYELEVQRLTQKVLGLEDQLAESQENELKAIREQEKLRNLQPIEQPVDVVSAQTSPRRDMDDGTLAERRERLQVYRSQLESMCQSLHFLILRCREQLNKTTHRGSTQSDVQEFESLQNSLRDLLSEIKQLQEMEGDFLSHPSGSVNERILRQNEELTNFIVRISEEKTELRSTLSNLEEEIWRYRQLDAKYQELQRSTEGSDHVLMSERADWAKERLSLQMALNAAEREIDMLQTDLRIERERRVAAGITDARETDKVKIERLYGKYLRAESFRKMLIYQKKYLLVLLGGFQDTEETTLALLAQMGAVDRRRQSMRRSYSKPLTSFRSAVRVVIAITRMKYLVKKWRRATRVGSEVVGGAVDQSNGYMPQNSSYSPPRHRPSTRLSATPTRSSSSPSRSSHHHISPQRSSDPVYGLQTRADFETYSSSSYESSRPFGHVMSTPPTKDYSGTKRYSSPSSGARRKILTSATIPAPSQVRFAADDSKIGDLGETDDYIHRLESLQSRLGTLQNGKKSSWKQPWR